MSYHHEEFHKRSQKLKEIKELGITPYPHKYAPTHTAEKLHEQYQKDSVGNSEEAAEGKTPSVCIAGRVVLFRAMGKNAFAQIQDGSKRLQIMFNKAHTTFEQLIPESISPLKFIEKKIDLGDLIGVEGHLFRTQKDELTIFVKKVTLLCKTLLPLPDKHSGLVDKESRYRKRWLDLISHENICQTFEKRSKILNIIRHYLYQHDFMEVETPILQNIYGGAEAKPFSTHLHAINQDIFLRISLEISLKKILVGGMKKIYEIGKVFRNEGLDRTHNPEFTMLEAYATYQDYHDMMRFTENLIAHTAHTLHGHTKMLYSADTEEISLDLKTPWKRMTMKESILQYAGIDVDQLSEEEMRLILHKETSVDAALIQKSPRGLLIATLFDEKVSSKLIQPHHIIDHPIETTPLCKPHRDPSKRKEGLVERFETFILGRELCNGYSELNDPEIQRTLLEEQAQKRKEGDEEAHPLDEEFLEAICQGMPPTAGVGIGVDRLVMLLTNTSSIREVLYFPIMKRLS